MTLSISGIVMRRWRPLTADLQCNLEIAIWANHIQVLNEEKSDASVTEEMVRQINKIFHKQKYYYCFRKLNLIYIGLVIKILGWKGGMSL